MNIVLILLITIVLLIDFIKLKKNTRKVPYLYILIVAIALIVATADKYDFFTASPLEMGIKKVQPITDWAKNKLN